MRKIKEEFVTISNKSQLNVLLKRFAERDCLLKKARNKIDTN